MNALMNKYQNNQVATASPEQLLIMLYDGAIRFLRQASESLEAKDQEGKVRGIRNGMAIITEFRNTLDHKIGGQVASDLDALYDFMIRELTQSNIKNDIEKLKVVVGLLVGLRETWAQAIDKVRQEALAGQTEGSATKRPLAASY